MPKNKDLLNKLKIKNKPKPKEKTGFIDYLKYEQGNLEDWMNENVNEPLAKKGYKTAGAALSTLGSLPTAFAIDTAEDVKKASKGDLMAAASILPPGKLFKAFKGVKTLKYLDPLHADDMSKFLKNNPNIAKNLDNMSAESLETFIKANPKHSDINMFKELAKAKGTLESVDKKKLLDAAKLKDLKAKQQKAAKEGSTETVKLVKDPKTGGVTQEIDIKHNLTPQEVKANKQRAKALKEARENAKGKTDYERHQEEVFKNLEE